MSQAREVNAEPSCEEGTNRWDRRCSSITVRQPSRAQHITAQSLSYGATNLTDLLGSHINFQMHQVATTEGEHHSRQVTRSHGDVEICRRVPPVNRLEGIARDEDNPSLCYLHYHVSTYAATEQRASRLKACYLSFCQLVVAVFVLLER